MKKYLLMHKNIPVADLKLDTATGVITSIGAIYEPEHAPVGIPVKKGHIDRGALNEWWQDRAIPDSRAGIIAALLKLGFCNTRLLPDKCLGLSLSDQYWICPADSGIRWEQVNFFENPFSEDVGNILLGDDPDSREVCLMSPDNTCDGWLTKKWKIEGGRRWLLKGGSNAAQQEPYNEALASCIMERLHIPHVSYSLQMDKGHPYSICENFLTPDTELVSAWYLMQTEKKLNHISVYQHYQNCCRHQEIPGVQEALNQMLVLDYIILNEDRHLNNFGAIRRADTLEYVGMAPIYDSGTSLWFDRPLQMIHSGARATCKPFKNSHREQIKLVTDFDWVDFSALHGIDEELRELVRNSPSIDEARCEALCRGLIERIEMLQKIIMTMEKKTFVDSTRFDVTQNIAYSGNKNGKTFVSEFGKSPV
ncbi:MAG: HipA domain-containing protein [Eubacteriales bacterium]|nr:HipA domain-containing protein [Eubacteriales bacterium]